MNSVVNKAGTTSQKLRFLCLDCDKQPRKLFVFASAEAGTLKKRVERVRLDKEGKFVAVDRGPKRVCNEEQALFSINLDEHCKLYFPEGGAPRRPSKELQLFPSPSRYQPYVAGWFHVRPKNPKKRKALSENSPASSDNNVAYRSAVCFQVSAACRR